MTETPRPGYKGATFEQNLRYINDVLRITGHFAERLAKRWSRIEPQSMEEVEEGIRAERKRRLAAYDEGVENEK